MKTLRHRLKRAGVTLKEVAEATGESQSTICHVLYEAKNGRIRFSAEKLLKERIEECASTDEESKPF